MIYDKDKNNEPATKYGGERAHWLMITGFCNKPSRNSRSGVLVTSQRGNIALQPSNSYSKTRGEWRLRCFFVKESFKFNGEK